MVYFWYIFNSKKKKSTKIYQFLAKKNHYNSPLASEISLKKNPPGTSPPFGGENSWVLIPNFVQGRPAEISGKNPCKKWTMFFMGGR